MRIPVEQLDKMAYQVHRIPEGKSIGDIYPEFNKYPAFDVKITESSGRKALIDAEFVLRYVVLLWSKDSPLWTISDFLVRKEVAADIVKQRYKGNAPKNTIDKLLDNELGGVNEMEIAFAIMNGGPLLAQYTTTFKLLYSVMADITSPLIVSDKLTEEKVTNTYKSRIINVKGLTLLRKELDVLAKELWPQQAEMRKMVDRHLQQSTKAVKAQYVAEAFATGGGDR